VSDTELCRLRTYDCPHVVTAEWDVARTHLNLKLEERGSMTIDGQSPDVGPFQLFERIRTTSQKLANSRFLQAPGASQALNDWSYRQAVDVVGRRAQQCEGVYVCGYSFPSYDTGVREMIATIGRRLDHPPATIVDPAARQMPKDVLGTIFGDNYCLVTEGFGTFEWS
jgi:hypothetical protein